MLYPATNRFSAVKPGLTVIYYLLKTILLHIAPEMMDLIAHCLQVLSLSIIEAQIGSKHNHQKLYLAIK